MRESCILISDLICWRHVKFELHFCNDHDIRKCILTIFAEIIRVTFTWKVIAGMMTDVLMNLFDNGK